ncbi:alpha/beta fold hydrolase [Synechococcus sp. PCC 6312]|uniref:alpha/beta fold hydrolase n=1 Tax=Synechococcus sp. (strain ATCC 27167 / PCC 6312) TaxID=195253 RepID=UPI00029F4BF9|nr:alpha/beta hydrolase [Synechococcus sp. PCC 6312]AFY59375.1 putative hydrolase or acyltransferase of alpha/beta superfamily [Synechococcus sp. PCC 6312]
MSVLDGPWTHKFLISNGIKLHYVTQGEGPLVLLLHGFPEFWYSWRHQIPILAATFKVVALDLRGYNESDKPPDVGSYALEELVLDIEGVISSLGYERCILVGHDWGGFLAWGVAETYPQRIQKLCLLNAPHPAKFCQGLFDPQQLLSSWYIGLFQLPWLPETLLAWNDYQAIVTILQSNAINQTAFTPADLEAYKNAASRRGALRAMLNYYRNLAPGLGERDWPILNIPTLMLWGEGDKTLSQNLTLGTEEYVRDLRIHYIPHCGHWVQQEQPQLVNQYLSEFL